MKLVIEPTQRKLKRDYAKWEWTHESLSSAVGAAAAIGAGRPIRPIGETPVDGVKCGSAAAGTSVAERCALTATGGPEAIVTGHAGA